MSRGVLPPMRPGQSREVVYIFRLRRAWRPLFALLCLVAGMSAGVHSQVSMGAPVAGPGWAGRSVVPYLSSEEATSGGALSEPAILEVLEVAFMLPEPPESPESGMPLGSGAGSDTGSHHPTGATGHPGGAGVTGAADTAGAAGGVGAAGVAGTVGTIGAVGTVGAGKSAAGEHTVRNVGKYEEVQELLQTTRSRGDESESRGILFIWPVDGRVTDAFGWRIHPITGRQQFHNGIDIAAPSGTPVKAVASGTVEFTGWSEGYGRIVVIHHGQGYRTKYGHLSRSVVSQGQKVGRGEVIGYVGESGNATGPHCHFEVEVNGRAANPKDYLP